MLTLILLAADNPGVFVDHSAAAFESAMELTPIFLLLAPGLAIVIVNLIILRTERFRKRYVAFVAVGAVLSAVGLAAGIFSITSADRAGSDAETADAAYVTEVTNWIGDDYGIELTPAVTKRLVGGESFVTVYAGHPTTISVIETTGGLLAIVDENRAPLTPLR